MSDAGRLPAEERIVLPEDGRSITISWGHGDRHAVEEGISPEVMRNAIKADFATRSLNTNGERIRMGFGGQILEYRVYKLGPDRYRIGTYFLRP